MRIAPVGQHISFWAVHWPWWRIKLRTAYGVLPTVVRHALKPGSGRLLPREEDRLERTRPPEPEARLDWTPPPRADRTPLGLHWPSDEPPPPPPVKVDLRIIEEPKPPKTGRFFDDLI